MPDDQPKMTLRGHGGSSVSSLCFLRKNLLLSCDSSEEGCLTLWNIDSRRIITKLNCKSGSDENGINNGGGLFVGRFSTCSDKFIYQQRNGLSVYDIEAMQKVSFVETDTLGFCQATTCDNLVIFPDSLPNRSSSFNIWDHRCDQSTVKKFAAFGEDTDEKYGMLSSLSAVIHGNNLDVACGTESGAILYHSLTYSPTTVGVASSVSALSVGIDPVLGIDLVPSGDDGSSSAVGVAGVAGDAIEIAQKIKPEDRGTIVTFKVKPTYDGSQIKSTLKMRQRINTCEVGSMAAGGKPGVACCKFRNDGRIFATGGWDRRIRVFSRSGKSLAILKGHSDSVTCLDWNPWIHHMLATGSADSRISLWDVSF